MQNFRALKISRKNQGVVMGEPQHGPKGRWHIRGGINVPVNLTFQTHKSKAKEIKNSVQQKGIAVTIKPDDKHDGWEIN